MFFLDDLIIHVKIDQLGVVQRRKQQLMGSEIRPRPVEFGLSHFLQHEKCISGGWSRYFSSSKRLSLAGLLRVAKAPMR